MNLKEIYQTTPRLEYNDQRKHYFDYNSPVVYTHQPTRYKLKRNIDEHKDVRYGLFDNTEQILISYASFQQEGDWYISSMPSTDPKYQKQGWMTLIFTFAVNHDHLKIMSDDQQTPEAKQLWKALASRGKFAVKVYNTNTNQIIDWTPENDPYLTHNEQTHRLIAIPHLVNDKQLSEQYSAYRGDERAIRKQLGIFDYGQYGIGTSTDDFINW